MQSPDTTNWTCSITPLGVLTVTSGGGVITATPPVFQGCPIEVIWNPTISNGGIISYTSGVAAGQFQAGLTDSQGSLWLFYVDGNNILQLERQMPAFLQPRVKETTTTTGTGTMQLLGAPAGYRSFLSAFGANARCYYFVNDGANFEYGLGTINSSSQLARTLIINSSAAGAITLAAGTKTVLCALLPDNCVNNGTIVFPDLDTTPSVRFSPSAWLASNTGATTITDFDDDIDGKVLNIIFTNGNTTIQHNANIRLSAGANFTGTSNDTMRLVASGGIWYEVQRSVNT